MQLKGWDCFINGNVWQKWGHHSFTSLQVSQLSVESDSSLGGGSGTKAGRIVRNSGWMWRLSGNTADLFVCRYQYPRLENSRNRGAWRLQSMESQRVRHDWNDLACIHATEQRISYLILEYIWGLFEVAQCPQ